jgi:hypothetical protein
VPLEEVVLGAAEYWRLGFRFSSRTSQWILLTAMFDIFFLRPYVEFARSAEMLSVLGRAD